MWHFHIHGQVIAEVEEFAKDKKVMIFKMRRRKNSKRLRGFRRDLTILRVRDIILSPDDEALLWHFERLPSSGFTRIYFIGIYDFEYFGVKPKDFELCWFFCSFSGVQKYKINIIFKPTENKITILSLLAQQQNITLFSTWPLRADNCLREACAWPCQCFQPQWIHEWCNAR